MKCVLMNKDTEVLLVDYNEVSKFFDEIIDIYNIEYAPYILKKFYDKDDINSTLFRTNFSDWFKGRGIPRWR